MCEIETGSTKIILTCSQLSRPEPTVFRSFVPIGCSLDTVKGFDPRYRIGTLGDLWLWKDVCNGHMALDYQAD
jgi:hypothetical protein